MYKILESLKSKETSLAIEWAVTNNIYGLEFELHKLKFIQLIQEDTKKAILYSRKHFSKFDNKINEIKQLMGCLIYSKNLKNSPYWEYLDESLWEDVYYTFHKECFRTLNQPTSSPLFVVTNAGYIAIPSILKYLSIKEINKEVIEKSQSVKDQIGIEIDLGEEYTFQSIFACPVTKQMTTNENPPMLLPCGHVLSKESIDKLGSKFKCPYCPLKFQKINVS
jgi:E3 ubiquitin-protein transferase RMND5